jgi:hypothetical protein
MRKKRKRVLVVGDAVEIVNPESIAHLGQIMPATLIDIRLFDGSPDIGGKAEFDAYGRPVPAFLCRYEDGSGYVSIRHRSEIRERLTGGAS